MSWITLTAADLEARLAGAELTALKTKGLSAGQADPIPEILDQVTKEVRGHVAACTHNQLGAGATIPEELKSAALDMARYRVIDRLPVPSLMTEARRTANRDARRLLELVAGCQFTIEQPATPSTASTAGPAAQVAASRTKKATGTQLNGL
jgi:hypothetical protein